jgi:hypothetical protein
VTRRPLRPTEPCDTVAYDEGIDAPWKITSDITVQEKINTILSLTRPAHEHSSWAFVGLRTYGSQAALLTPLKGRERSCRSRHARAGSRFDHRSACPERVEGPG